MDFELDPTQEAVLDAVGTILQRQAGNERARELGTSKLDMPLLDTLGQAGYLDLFADPDTGPLCAELVVEAVSRANGRIPIGARALVASAVLDEAPPACVALARADQPDAPVRFAPDADIVLVLDHDLVRVIEPADVTPVESPFGFPFGRLDLSGGRTLQPGSGETMQRWWRLATAAELVGAMQGALDHTVEYVSQREQFGRPLGSLQAIQHRLAEAHVWAEGARWLVRAAASNGAIDPMVHAAAGYTSDAARLIGSDTHQLSGAIGFTLEFDLQLWTTRIHGLRIELGSAAQHHRQLADQLWGMRKS